MCCLHPSTLECEHEMREAKGYRDPYTDIKRSSAFEGPYYGDTGCTSVLWYIAAAVVVAFAFVALFYAGTAP